MTCFMSTATQILIYKMSILLVGMVQISHGCIWCYSAIPLQSYLSSTVVSLTVANLLWVSKVGELKILPAMDEDTFGLLLDNLGMAM